MEPSRWDWLLRTAAHEFAEAGYERASLNRIIRRCGMSKSSFYHFVDSKQQLFEAVLSQYGPALVELMALPDPEDLADDFWAGLTGIVDRLMAASSRDEIYLLLGRMWYLPGAPSGDATMLGRGLAAVDGWLKQALVVGRRAGAVRDDLPLELQAHLVTALVQVFDEWSLQHHGPGEVAAGHLAHAQLAALHRLIGT